MQAYPGSPNDILQRSLFDQSPFSFVFVGARSGTNVENLYIFTQFAPGLKE
jgi:hypothetical protein